METHSEASWAPPARLGRLPSARSSSLPRTICYTWPTTPRTSSEPLWYMPSTPNPVQANSSHWGSRVQGGQETIAFPLWRIPAQKAVLRQGGGPNVWTPWVSGHSSSWILGISAWRQQEAETPPGSLADAHHRCCIFSSSQLSWLFRVLINVFYHHCSYHHQHCL